MLNQTRETTSIISGNRIKDKNTVGTTVIKAIKEAEVTITMDRIRDIKAEEVIIIKTIGSQEEAEVGDIKATNRTTATSSSHTTIKEITTTIINNLTIN